MLPKKQLFDELFSEYFIIYKPRDIVSGDFYWFAKVNKYKILAVADCTGHGVPGAFVSMLGISFLNEIVRKKSVTDAKQVLEELRTQIKLSLNQTGNESETKDGMDISICVFDCENNRVQYSQKIANFQTHSRDKTNVHAKRRGLFLFVCVDVWRYL